MLTNDKFPTVYTLECNSSQINQHNSIKFIYLRLSIILAKF